MTSEKTVSLTRITVSRKIFRRQMEIKDLSALKVVELKERLEVSYSLYPYGDLFQELGLSTNGLKADLVDRLREHYEKVRSIVVESHSCQESRPEHNSTRKASDSSPKIHSSESAEKHVVAASLDSSPKSSSPKSRTVPHDVANASPKHSDHGNHDASDETKPSAIDLARKRAERFGIPVVPKGDEEMEGEPPMETPPEEEKDKHHHDPTAMEKYRELITETLGESPILEVDDFMTDSRTAVWIDKVIQQSGEEKVREIIKQVSEKIASDFNNDRSTIKSPPRLVSFRFSRSLKSLLPRPEKRDRVRKDIDKRSDKKRESQKEGNDSRKKKLTDAEWADRNKKKEDNGGLKKKDYGDWKKGQGEWRSNDWNSKGKPGSKGGSKNRSYSYDSFESDVEEFIHSNKLDNKASKVLREESKNLVNYVMDQGFSLRSYSNPSKEVMLRMKDYIRKKRDDKYDRGYSARSRSRSRSYSPKPKSNSYSKDAKYRSSDYDRSVSRGRSYDRANSRDRYDRRSRSRSI